MRLNHLDILEQCFRDKLFGYNKEDVDTFLQILSDDFKEMSEELELLNLELTTVKKVVAKLQDEVNHPLNKTKETNTNITPEIIKEKAKRIINAAREHADQHKKKAEQELSNLKKEINKIKQEKISLADVIKTNIKEHVSQQK